jgi:hypothetical protein
MKVLYSTVLIFLLGICFAEEPKVYTDDDLGKYKKEPMFQEDPSYKAKQDEYRRYNQQKEAEEKAEAERLNIEKEKANQKRLQEQVDKPAETQVQVEDDSSGIYVVPKSPRPAGPRIRHY